ncbi:hypothetical protein EVAR_45610_1 [Eumeta japonica]|uniref:Uncharacterized protein n=1 Tax=Eumeta variegata TaxID=151549 RepID=A0A4C1WDS1_EUMVA|nr:hypothetical protein EVAR_45610_1 [Eumeta japonica]
MPQDDFGELSGNHNQHERALGPRVKTLMPCPGVDMNDHESRQHPHVSERERVSLAGSGWTDRDPIASWHQFNFVDCSRGVGSRGTCCDCNIVSIPVLIFQRQGMTSHKCT